MITRSSIEKSSPVVIARISAGAWPTRPATLVKKEIPMHYEHLARPHGRRGGSLAAAVGLLTIALTACAGGPAAGQAGGGQPGTQAIYLIQRVQVITGTGALIPEADVLIRNGRIEGLSRDRLEAADATVIDGRGKTLMPGLIDSHMHINVFLRGRAESDAFLKGQIPGLMKGLLRQGITTIKDLGDPEYFIFKLRRDLDQARILGPRLVVVGPNITAPGGHPAVDLGKDNPWGRKQLAAEIGDPEAGRRKVRDLAAKGVDFIKIVMDGGEYSIGDEAALALGKLDMRVAAAIIDEAARVGLKVSSHTVSEADVRKLLAMGVYGIDHGVVDAPIAGVDLPGLFRDKGAFYVPTLTILEAQHKRPGQVAMWRSNFAVLHRGGVKIAAGTDMLLAGMPATSLHSELAQYVQAGMTPMEALVSATGNAADYLGLGQVTGKVEEGLCADLVLLDADPLVDIKNSLKISLVFRNGFLAYSKAASAAAKPLLPACAFPASAAYVDRTRRFAKADVESTLSYYGAGPASSGGTLVQEFSTEGHLLAQSTATLGPDAQTRSWEFSFPAAGTSLSARVADDSLVITGTYGGRAVERSFDLGADIWLQSFPYDLGTFVRSGLERLSFKLIAIDGPEAARAHTFISTKVGMEKVELGGRRYDCVVLATQIEGFGMWTGLSWHEKETGLLVKYRVKGSKADEVSLVGL